MREWGVAINLDGLCWDRGLGLKELALVGMGLQG